MYMMQECSCSLHWYTGFLSQYSINVVFFGAVLYLYDLRRVFNQGLLLLPLLVVPSLTALDHAIRATLDSPR